jgi:hypothetical protein
MLGCVFCVSRARDNRLFWLAPSSLTPVAVPDGEKCGVSALKFCRLGKKNTYYDDDDKTM